MINKDFIAYWEREADCKITISPAADRVMMRVTCINNGETDSICIGGKGDTEECLMQVARSQLRWMMRHGYLPNVE